MAARTDFLPLLRALERHGVEYVLVGGVAAVLAGAPIFTFDLNIVFDAGPANLERLLEMLLEIDAIYRDPAGRSIPPTLERLQSHRMNLLQTRLGVLDVMREISPGWDYANLLARSGVQEVAGMRIRVLDLASVVESKTSADRDKDRAVLPVLRRTLEMRQRRGE